MATPRTLELHRAPSSDTTPQEHRFLTSRLLLRTIKMHVDAAEPTIFTIVCFEQSLGKIEMIRPTYTAISTVFLALLMLFHQNSNAKETCSTGILGAAEIAKSDFEERLQKENGSSWEFAEYVSNIRNYSIGLSENDSSYIVVFTLNKTNVKINGGGGRYTIDKKRLEVTKFIGNE